MKADDIVNKLHPLERKVLSSLTDKILFSELVKKTGLKDVEVMRGIQWLSNKKLITSEEKVKEIIELDKNGEQYKQIGLPERRFLVLQKK